MGQLKEENEYGPEEGGNYVGHRASRRGAKERCSSTHDLCLHCRYHKRQSQGECYAHSFEMLSAMLNVKKCRTKTSRTLKCFLRAVRPLFKAAWEPLKG